MNVTVDKTIHTCTWGTWVPSLDDREERKDTKQKKKGGMGERKGDSSE